MTLPLKNVMRPSEYLENFFVKGICRYSEAFLHSLMLVSLEVANVEVEIGKIGRQLARNAQKNEACFLS